MLYIFINLMRICAFVLVEWIMGNNEEYDNVMPDHMTYTSPYSTMYWEGYWAARDGKPCVCAYPVGSEAWEDFANGHANYKQEHWTPDL